MLMKLVVVLFLTKIVSSQDCGLFKNVKDLKYDLEIVPDLSNFVFTATAQIQLLTLEETNSLVFEAQNLQLSSTNPKIDVYEISDSENPIENEFTSSSDCWNINFPTALPEGTYNIRIVYNGVLNKKREGLYVATIENDYIHKPILLGNLGPGHARKVFPCLERSDIPAKFKISLIRSTNYISISNTPLLTTTTIEENSIEKDEFQESEELLTHQLSFAILTDFHTFHIEENFPLLFSQLTNPSVLSDEVKKILDTLKSIRPSNDGKEITYLAQIVVPDDALPRDSIIAKGLILYRQSAVELDESKSTSEEKQIIFNTLSYALSSQWFYETQIVNYVSHPHSEGRVIDIQQEIGNVLRSEWRLHEQFVIRDLNRNLEVDVGDDAENLIVDDFYDLDSILSRKFYIIGKMFLGLESPPENFFKSWEENLGYPFLKIDRNYETSTITACQVLFVTQNSRTWQIPFTLVAQDESGDTANVMILNQTCIEIDTSNSPTKWTIAIPNLQQIGYYRVNYDETNWGLIINDLKNPKSLTTLHQIDKARLIDDAYNLAENNYLNYEIYLNLTEYVHNEVDFIPLYTFYRTARRLSSLLSQTATQDKFKKHCLKVLTGLYETVGSNIINSYESHISRLRRVETLTFLCDFGHIQCRTDMFGMLSQLRNPHPDMEEAAYRGGMRNGSLDHFLWLTVQYANNRKARILKAMGATSDLTSITAYLTTLLDPSLASYKHPEHRIIAFASVYEGSEMGRQMALQFLAKNFNQIADSFSEKEVSEMVLGLSRNIGSQTGKMAISSILGTICDDHRVTFEAVIQKALKIIDQNMEWKETHLETIDEWLDRFAEPTTTEAPTTKPPITKPPSSEPPVTEAPITEAPITEPAGGGANSLQLVQSFIVPFSVVLAIFNYMVKNGLFYI